MRFLPLMRAVWAAHTAIYQATGGRVGARLGTVPILLLTTRRRGSGRLVTRPLAYVPTDDGFAVAASYGGSDHDPAWLRNLRADPRAVVRVGARVVRVLAAEAPAAERARLWPRFVATYHGFAGYQARTARLIPVVLLRPVELAPERG